MTECFEIQVLFICQKNEFAQLVAKGFPHTHEAYSPLVAGGHTADQNRQELRSRLGNLKRKHALTGLSSQKNSMSPGGMTRIKQEKWEFNKAGAKKSSRDKREPPKFKESGWVIQESSCLYTLRCVDSPGFVLQFREEKSHKQIFIFRLMLLVIRPFLRIPLSPLAHEVISFLSPSAFSSFSF